MISILHVRDDLHIGDRVAGYLRRQVVTGTITAIVGYTGSYVQSVNVKPDGAGPGERVTFDTEEELATLRRAA